MGGWSAVVPLGKHHDLVHYLPAKAVGVCVEILRLLLAVDSGVAHARVMNLDNGESALLPEQGPDSLKGAQLLPDGRVLSCHHSSLLVWDVASNVVQRLTGHEDSVEGMLQVGDARVASWSADRSLRVWEVTTSAQVMRFDFDAQPTAVVALPDGPFVGDKLGGTHFLEWPAETEKRPTFGA